MYVQNFSPKFYHLRHFKKEKRCSLNFCTDYSTCKIPVKLTVNTECRRKVKLSCALTVKLCTCVRLIKSDNTMTPTDENEQFYFLTCTQRRTDALDLKAIANEFTARKEKRRCVFGKF